jgi:hypothetical protein
MVGWMGQCCCGPTDPPPPLCDTDAETELFEDFVSHEFFIQSQMQVVNAQLQLTGRTNPGRTVSEGLAIAPPFKKVTQAGDITFTVKLVDWHNVLTPFTEYKAQIKVAAPWSYFRSFGVEAYNAHFKSLNRYRFICGVEGTLPNQQIVLPVTPQDGDTFGFRMKNFSPLPPFSNIVVCESVDVLVNGAVVYTYTGQDQPAFDQCYLSSYLYLEQPVFNDILTPGQTVLRLDDFYGLCE